METITTKTSLLILQSTSYCNLNCNYCYLGDRQTKNTMSQPVKEAVFKKVLRSSYLEPNLSLCWHAGEPLSAGIDFYQDIQILIDRYKQSGQNVRHSFQTNGTLINDEWCAYFKKTDAQIGVSVDGPDFIHNKSRVNWKGKGTHSFTMRGIRALQENGIPFHTISVLSTHSLDYPDEMFEFYYTNQIPGPVCFNFEETESGNTTSYVQSDLPKSVLMEKYKAFFSRFYDLTCRYEAPFRVREFDGITNNLLSYRFNNERGLTSDEVTPFRLMTIDHRGNVHTYSPELAGGYLDKDFSIGNIMQVENVDELRQSERLFSIKEEIDAGVEKCKSECDYFNFCGGGGASNKYCENGTFNSSETRYCKFHKQGLIDLMIQKFQPKYTLIPGIEISGIDELLQNQLITICSGTEFAKDTGHSEKYVHRGKIPTGDWRSLDTEEIETLRVPDIHSQSFSRRIQLLKIPDQVLPPSILHDIHQLHIDGPIESQALARCLAPYQERLGQFAAAQCLNEDIESLGYIYRQSKGLPTTTTDRNRDNLAIGLHIDNWDHMPLESRSKSRPRLCINLGHQDRYFVFINLSLAQMYELITGMLIDKVKIRNAQNEIIQEFMEQNPGYPVLKLKVPPLYAYVAPTENIIHDGYHPNSGEMDTTWTYFGNFDRQK